MATTLGIEIGASYHLELFHAERKPAVSNFRIETTLDFTGCDEILPVDIVK
jgi:fibro-slime domain-containing protein